MGDMSREPSMEEILSSIRRVIARDEDARNGAGSPGVPPHDGAAGDDDDVLELSGDAALATGQDGEDGIDGLVNSQVMSPASPAPAGDAATAEPLVSNASAEASRQSLDALNAAIAQGSEAAPDTVGGHTGDMTINAMVESLLRPMLRQWLDSNLPPLVERLVAREIARITGNRF